MTSGPFRSLSLFAVLVGAALPTSQVLAEVNRAVRIEEWSLGSSTCQDYHLSQLGGHLSCRAYTLPAQVKVRNITAQRTGKNLIVSLRTNTGVVCSSQKIVEDIYAGGYVLVDLTCSTKSKDGSSAVPSSVEALVHQEGNLSNGVSGGTKNAPWCQSFSEQLHYGSCGNY